MVSLRARGVCDVLGGARWWCGRACTCTRTLADCKINESPGARVPEHQRTAHLAGAGVPMSGCMPRA
eukprot:4809504-Alexandrium_andersonii.AAC.1